ncbi:hypothetical protein L249_8605 [Ophiocordyceps polyrhachis-furcata BCC 54312]|uniref:PIPK domain-containing protein n=1 Tax=Ophiocordyceps polyrhachis-furcata BCC 54312 TaxID=1330021 RepID=A0A367L7C7_9HYPO|nr:hypothetical protein L249_8605 [Ophiocordyceps polyrhachis-furcata BCC 54312]
MAQPIGVPDRIVPMRVIVVGAHRTGTMSMRCALWMLGFHDCYHMHSVMQNQMDHPDMWARAIEAKFAGKGTFTRADWDRLLGHYQACCDVPAAFFSTELAEMYPEAKVVVLNRDPNKWYESALHTVHKAITDTPLSTKIIQLYCFALDEQTRSWARFLKVMKTYCLDFDHGKERDKAIAWFEGQYKECHDRIPAERCLEYTIKDGWEPLCEHLGVPIPTIKDPRTGEVVEAPFPRINDRESFQINVKRGLKRSLSRANKNAVMLVGRLAMVSMVAYGAYTMWKRNHGDGESAAVSLTVTSPIFMMKVRSRRISASIADAITQPAATGEERRPGCLGPCIYGVAAFSAFYRLDLAPYRPADFLRLRRHVWELDEEAYSDSFRSSSDDDDDDDDASHQLVPVGDLGYSGSTFFTTPNGCYLVKSLPRSFEHEFFTQDLFDAYSARMTDCPGSLLVRITDMVFCPHATLGGILGSAPTHHIIMENLLHLEGDHGDAETYDLKPDDYFFPERDIADGRLAPAGIKDRLVDKFPGEVCVSPEAKRKLVTLLEADTALLADSSAVDYSLFFVRFPQTTDSPFADSHASPSSWRTGVASTDGRWTYRAVVLDFFWAKKKMRAKAMTGLVAAFNLLARKGPMSITAEPAEYRARFLRMVNKLVTSREPLLPGPDEEAGELAGGREASVAAEEP